AARRGADRYAPVDPHRPIGPRPGRAGPRPRSPPPRGRRRRPSHPPERTRRRPGTGRPLAGRDGAAAALALRAELARRTSQPAEVLLPGTARSLVETALASGLRPPGPPGLLLLSGRADPPQALAISGNWLL